MKVRDYQIVFQLDNCVMCQFFLVPGHFQRRGKLFGRAGILFLLLGHENDLLFHL